MNDTSSDKPGSLDNFLAKNSNSQALAHGLEIHKKGNFELISIDVRSHGVAYYKVKSERGWDSYNVVIQNFRGAKPNPSLHCSCPYNWGGLCKHRVAALIDLSNKGHWEEPMPEPPPVVYDMLDSVLPINDLSDTSLRAVVSDDHWKKRTTIKKVEILAAKNGVAETRVIFNGYEQVQRFSRIKIGEIHSSCACAQKIGHPCCEHKLAALLTLREQYGSLAFESMRDWTAQKNQLLSEYGFNTDDDLRGKFDFKINNKGILELKVLDPGIKAPDQLSGWWKSNSERFKSVSRTLSLGASTEEEPDTRRILIYSLTMTGVNLVPDVTLVPLTGRYNESKDKLSHISKIEQIYAQYGTDSGEMPAITDQDSRLLHIARSGFAYQAIATHLRKQGFSLPYWHYSNFNLNEADDILKEALLNHIGGIWDRVLPLLADKFTVFSNDTQNRVNSLHRTTVIAQPLRPRFELRSEGDFIVLEGFTDFGEETISIEKLEPLGFWLRTYEGKVAKLSQYRDALLLQQFNNTGKIKIKKDYLPSFLANFVLPLTAHYSVDFSIDKDIDYQKLSWKEGRIYLKEDASHLLLIPMYAYSEKASSLKVFANETLPKDPETETQEPVVEFTDDGRKDHITFDESSDQITIWNRQPEKEKAFREQISALHEDFKYQVGDFFHIPFNDVLRNHWLFQFFEHCTTQGIAIFGFSQLKKFKYNPNRPKVQIRASSGIDWFDMKMEIFFGEQVASLAEVRKAVLNKQQYVQLGDGSIGMLPEEWIAQYANLFKFGQVQGDSMKVSKMHFSLIDQLSEHIDNEKLLQELAEKKQKLLHFKEIKNIPLPKNITATLRDYQQEGFKWLNFLDEFSWGGCLADDMGLGKTLQVLTFLQEIKNRDGGGTSLIVMPTTLIFNWQAEIKKFTPELTYYVHRGITRQRNTDFLPQYDLILTTYGTLRSDVEFMKEFKFRYIVLDESQAIKNPGSLTSKAVKLLSAQNRLVMTGTPVENNTFDLYSQVEFLNPGLLGTQEFFRSEFANPIDKHRDADRASDLRQLIYPFILKRTKEEVAKDLPDKTETILFCEMGKKQRKVYETFRDSYKMRIMEKMEEEGREKSAFLILEGLLKLRQICDSPELLSDDEDYGTESTKLDEIIREIEENAGNHKILVFSQFLKMLDLVRQHLEKANISYEYLDGQTRDRADRVNHFQNNEQCRVFLMSLKAGGVGINLTEADYVYLIDPWWNPAVEQQAIDRTHRIGQTKKVFAYRMICKDTVEEKIMELQAKKKDIARDLISTEEGLLKKLTKDDIVALFT